jgi:hypothetical protein
VNQRLISLGISIVWLCGLAAFMLPPLLRPLNYPADDAYFYLQIAHNIVDGHGSTFSTITPTNGYHPLWLAVCTLVSLLVSNNKGLALILILLTQQLLGIAILLIIRRIAKILDLGYWWVAMCVIAGVFFSGLYYSEAHLNGFFLVLSIALLLKVIVDDGLRMGWYVIAGLSFGLTILARLDNVIVVTVFYVFALCHLLKKQSGPSPRSGFSRSLALSFSAAAVTTPYLTFNYLTTGQLVPISGAIKSTFPTIVPGLLDKLGQIGTLTSVFAVFGLVIGFSFQKRTLAGTLLSLLSLGVLLHSGYVVLFTSGATLWSWYYISGIINLALTLVVATNLTMKYIQRRKSRILNTTLQAGVLVATLSLILVSLVRTWARYNNPDAVESYGPSFSLGKPVATERWQRMVGTWLGENLPTDSRILVFDWPGQFSYFSGLGIVPTDGLVNDFEYNNDIVKEGISRYLSRRRVNYWLGPSAKDSLDGGFCGWKIMRFNSGYSVEVFAPLNRKSAGCFFVRDSDRVVEFRKVIPHPGTSEISLWRIAAVN